MFIVFLTDPVKAPESCKIAQIFGFNDLHISLFLGGGGRGGLLWVWICKKEDLATIIVTLKKESIFRFSRWFEIKNLILDYPRETHPHDMKGIKRKVMHTTLRRQLLFTLQGFWSWKNNLRFLIYKNKYLIIYSHF